MPTDASTRQPSPPRRASWRLSCALLLLIAAALVTNIRLLRESLQPGDEPADFDACLSSWIVHLPDRGVVGYLGSDQNDEPVAAGFHRAQYILAPRILRRGPHGDFVVANGLSDDALAEHLTADAWRRIADCPNGPSLYARVLGESTTDSPPSSGSMPPEAPAQPSVSHPAVIPRLIGFLLLLLPFAAAYEIVSLVLAAAAGRTLRASLSFGLAVGLGSCTWFLWQSLVGPPALAFTLFEAAAFILVTFILNAVRRRRPRRAGLAPQARGKRTIRLAVFLGLVATLAIFSSVLLVLRLPHGQWDAWAIWNLRARFLSHGGDHWIDAFHARLTWSHPDYPLLLPSATARTWFYLGIDTPLAPATLSLFFTFATVALLGSAVAAQRGRTQGLVATLALLASTYFLRHGGYQYADTPLAFFILAACVFVAMWHRQSAGAIPPGCSALAGASAGLAAWTKNEGLLFVVVFVSVVGVSSLRGSDARRNRRTLFYVLIGLAPILAVVAYFKIAFAPPNDLLAAQGWPESWQRLTDLSRYADVAAGLTAELATFSTGLLPMLILYALLLGKAPPAANAPRAAPILSILILMLCGYFSVYVLTPHDLNWHLDTAARRLLLTLLPAALLLLFMRVASPDDLAAASDETATSP